MPNRGLFCLIDNNTSHPSGTRRRDRTHMRNTPHGEVALHRQQGGKPCWEIVKLSGVGSKIFRVYSTNKSLSSYRPQSDQGPVPDRRQTTMPCCSGSCALCMNGQPLLGSADGAPNGRNGRIVLKSRARRAGRAARDRNKRQYSMPIFINS